MSHYEVQSPWGDATHCVSQRERKEKERQTIPRLLQIGKGDFLETEFSSCIKEGERRYLNTPDFLAGVADWEELEGFPIFLDLELIIALKNPFL